MSDGARDRLRCGDQAMQSATSPRAPFYNSNLKAEGELPAVLANLREGITPVSCASAEARAGQLLASAVFNGALLDRLCWRRWLEGALSDTALADDLAWVEIEPLNADANGPDSQPRRWFADPITRLLLAHWHNDGIRTRLRDPERCLMSYFGTTNVEPGNLLLRHARLHWQLRIPPLLVAHALGEHRAVPVSGNDWRRLMNMDFNPAKEPYSATSNDESAPKSYNQPIRFLLNVLTKQKNSSAGKSLAAIRLSRLKSSCAPKSLAFILAEWCISMLKHPRGRQGTGYAPSTVAGYLVSLHRDVFETGDAPMSWSFNRLEECYDTKLSVIENGNQRNKTLNAIQHFHRYLCTRRGELNSLPEHLHQYRVEGRASANLIAPCEFKRALALCTRIEQKLCLILSFRAGLRLSETLGLTVFDFHIQGARCDLIVTPNSHRKLKTLTSRRIIPLDLLLEANELKLLRDWLATRRAAALATRARGLLVGPLDAAQPLRERVEVKKLDQILFYATKTALTVHHLRHSFASYMLATMSLPDDSSMIAVPQQLQSAVSLDRKVKLADRLLGPEKLGQHALHAVSALLGHIISTTTLRWYTHLLDLSLVHHVSRPAVQAAFPLAQVLELTGQNSRKAPVMLPVQQRGRAEGYLRPRPSPSPLDGTTPQLWQVGNTRGRRTRRVERVLSGPTSLKTRSKPRSVRPLPLDTSVSDWREILASLEGWCEHAHSESWRNAAEALLKLRLTNGRPRHARDALKIMSSEKWTSLVDDIWQRHSKLTSVERRALFFAVEHWDNGRCGVRFSSRPLALAWRDLLKKFGFCEEQIHLSVSGQFTRRSSAELHVLLAISNDLPGTAARRGRRGTIMVRFIGGATSSRQLRSAARFFALILAVSEEYPGIL